MKRIICFFLAVSLLLPMWGCSKDELASPGNFYYYRLETEYGGADGVIAPEVRELQGIENDIGAILDLYCQGPESRDLECILPLDTRVEGWTLADGTLSICLSEEFAQLSGIELTIAAACLTRTMLELTEAETVSLSAANAALDGQPAITMTAAQLSLLDDSLDRLREDFTIYYADAQRRYLIPQTVSLSPTDPDQLPQMLLEQLLSPPEDSGLRSVLPGTARVRSVSIEDGLCTVDFSQEFERSRFSSLGAQLLSLTGVVNTLTQLDTVDRVEFAVEGNLLIRYGDIRISEPLQADERFLGPVRTALGEQDGTLYLAHGSEGRLVSIPVRLRRTGAVSQAEIVLQALLSDPGINGLSSCIPEGTQLNSIRVERGICYVDLSEEYLSNTELLPYAGRVIAASLCETEGVSAVSITVDGAVPADLDPGIFGLLSPNDDWFL